LHFPLQRRVLDDLLNARGSSPTAQRTFDSFSLARNASVALNFSGTRDSKCARRSVVPPEFSFFFFSPPKESRREH